MKKKVFILVILATILVLTACSTIRQDGKNLNNETSNNNGESSAEEILGNSADELKAFDKKLGIEETVLLDENDVKITATELTYSNYTAELHLLIENNSSREYTFASGTIGYSCNAVNGYMVADGYLNVDVPAGEKTEDIVDFSIDGLRLYGINEIADVQIGFMIHDEESNYIYSGPRTVKTKAAEKYDYSRDTFLEAIDNNVVKAMYDYKIDYLSEEILYDTGGMKMYAEILAVNTDGEKILFLEVQNNSEDQVTAVVENVSINDEFNYEYIWTGTSVNPGARAIIDISADSVLKAVDIEEGTVTEINAISFTFSVNYEDYSPKTAPEEVRITF